MPTDCCSHTVDRGVVQLEASIQPSHLNVCDNKDLHLQIQTSLSEQRCVFGRQQLGQVGKNDYNKKMSRGQYLKPILQFSQMNKYNLYPNNFVTQQAMAGVTVIRVTTSYCWEKILLEE